MFDEMLTEDQRDRTHVFNTFFYNQLRKENRDTSSGLRFVPCHNTQTHLSAIALLYRDKC